MYKNEGRVDRRIVKSSDLPSPSPLGFGLGLRSKHYPYILENWPEIDWFEALTENYLGITHRPFGRPQNILEKIRENYPIVFHGVSLSIGSTDPLNLNYLQQVAQLAARFQPSWISDHLCWTGVGGENLHDLLPLPYTEEALNLVAERVDYLQNFYSVPFALENVSSYLTYKNSEMSEWEFLSTLVKRTGVFLLLDLNNIYVSSVNHQFDPYQFLNAIPKNSVIQFHLAGYSDHGSHLIDTHDHPISEPVWNLYEAARHRFGPISTCIEWDDNIPSFPELQTHLEMAKSV